MNKTGSLCPAVKAAAVIGDKWILLILRELLLGSTRYNDFQRALPRISPTILSKRLKQLERDGLIVKKSRPGQKSTEYRLTRCGRELGPVVDHISKWGLRWARRRIQDEDIDVAGFMWDFHRTLVTSELPDGETVFQITFSDQNEYSNWWLIAHGETVDLCTDDPGKEVDVYVNSSLQAMAEVWMGDVDIRAAAQAGKITISGASYIAQMPGRWFPKSRYADIRPEIKQ